MEEDVRRKKGRGRIRNEEERERSVERDVK